MNAHITYLSTKTESTAQYLAISIVAVLVIFRSTLLAQPVITTEPQDQLAIAGQRIALRASATTTSAPLQIQWRRENSPLPGKTNTTLTFTAIQPDEAGLYSALFTDASGSALTRTANVAVIGPVKLDAKISQNQRLGGDPPQLPIDRRAQAEPHLIRSFSNSRLLVAAIQEGRFEAGGAAAAIGYSVSKDGGSTWSRGLLPRLTVLTGGAFERASDPVAAIDLHGNIFVNSIGLPLNRAPQALLVSISTNQGASFGSPIVVERATGNNSIDKEWIAANTFPNSPTAHRIAVAYTFVRNQDELHISFSDDQGATWSRPTTITTGAMLLIGHLTFLADGSLVVIYTRYLKTSAADVDLTLPTQIECLRASDGGTNFGPPLVITSLTDRLHHDDVARDGYDIASACTDRQAGVLYVTYKALHGPTTNLAPQIMFTRSIDKGLTWTVPVPVNDTPGKQSVFNPCIAASHDGQHVTIAYYDKRHQTTNSQNSYVDFYLAESFDAGEKWEPNLRLSDTSTDLRLAPLSPGRGRMIADYEGIVPAFNFESPGAAIWIDTRNGTPDPYVVNFQRSKGPTFETWRKLRFTPAQLSDENMSGVDADPDRDGFGNGWEFLLAQEPTVPDSQTITLDYLSGSGGVLEATYRTLATVDSRRKFVRWQWSRDLKSWENLDPVDYEGNVRIDPINSARDEIQVRFPGRDSKAGFYRMAPR